MFNVNDEIFVNGFFAIIVEIDGDIAFVRDEDGAEHEVAIDAIDGHVIKTVVAKDFDANTVVGG